MTWDLFRPYTVRIDNPVEKELVEELIWQMNELPNMMGRIVSNNWYHELVIWLLWVVQSSRVRSRLLHFRISACPLRLNSGITRLRHAGVPTLPSQRCKEALQTVPSAAASAQLVHLRGGLLPDRKKPRRGRARHGLHTPQHPLLLTHALRQHPRTHSRPRVGEILCRRAGRGSVVDSPLQVRSLVI